MSNITHCTCSVIPPHILRRVADGGDSNEASRAAISPKTSSDSSSARRAFLDVASVIYTLLLNPCVAVTWLLNAGFRHLRVSVFQETLKSS
jgi:hypothetical protein